MVSPVHEGPVAPPTLDQFAGCFLGLCLGDALGAPVEALPPDEARRYVDEVLRTGRAGARTRPGFPFGQVTDDSQLTRELLPSIADAAGFNPADYARRIAAIAADGRLVGSGPGTTSAARQLLAGVPWHSAGIPAPYAGNGAAMRVAPLGLLFGHDPKRLAAVVADQSRITHQDPRCAAGAMAIAGAAALAARQRPLDRHQLLLELSHWVEPLDAGVAAAVRDLSRWAQLPADEATGFVADHDLEPTTRGGSWRGISTFVTSSVCWSLYAFLQAPEDYLEAVCLAITVGGDTDTLAAMTGAVVGAWLGDRALPRELTRQLTDRGTWGETALRALAARAYGSVFAR